MHVQKGIYSHPAVTAYNYEQRQGWRSLCPNQESTISHTRQGALVSLDFLSLQRKMGIRRVPEASHRNDLENNE